MSETIDADTEVGRPRDKTSTHTRLYKAGCDPLPYAEATAKALMSVCASYPLRSALPARTWNPSSRGPATSPTAIERPRGGA